MAYSNADVQVPRYQQVLDSIKTDILSGRYRPGQKLPSEAALLKRFRTSRITVGRAVRELQQAGLVRTAASNETNDRVISALERAHIRYSTAASCHTQSEADTTWLGSITGAQGT
jgi:DNA-binding FadR family transcriptional regulator